MGDINTIPLREERARVLLVGANQTFLHAVCEFLERYPELDVVGTSSSGSDALAQARLLQPQLILLDLDMPGMSGLQAILFLRRMLPQTSIIVLTLLDAEQYRSVALAAGASEYVPKASLTSDLIPVIQWAIRHSPSSGPKEIV